MKKIVLVLVLACFGFSATITVPTKNTGDSLTAAEFSQLIEATRYGTRDLGSISALNYTTTGTVTANKLTGTLQTAAQPNVTSLGTLTGLTVAGVTDIKSSGLSLTLGADNGATTRTESTLKNFRIVGAHYTNAERPVGVLNVVSDISGNSIYYGGSSSLLNAATDHVWYTGANYITQTGTEKMRMIANGNVGIGTTAPTVKLDVAGGINSSGTVSASALSLSGQPGVHAWQNTVALSIQDSTVSTINFNSERHDTLSNFSNGVFTVPSTGKYLILAQLNYAAEDVGVRNVIIRVNGVNIATNSGVASATSATIVNVSTIYSATVGDIILTAGYANSGSSVDIDWGGSSYMCIEKLN